MTKRSRQAAGALQTIDKLLSMVKIFGEGGRTKRERG